MGISNDSSTGGFSAQAEALFSRAEKFHSTTVQANAARWELSDRSSNQGAMREAAKASFTGIEVGSERGGLGLGIREKLRVAELLGRSSLSFTLGLLANQDVAVRLSEIGSARHRTDLLPGLLAGTRFGAIVVDGPGAADDGLALQATKTPGGWQLNGRSDWLINAASSDVFVAYADTGSTAAAEDVACFVVRSSQVGFKQSSPYRLIACSPLGVGGFQLDGYHCLDSDVLIGPGEAAPVRARDANVQRLEIAVLVCAAVRSSLAAAADSVADGTTAAGADLADSVTVLEAAEALTRCALDLFCQSPDDARTSALVGEAKKFSCAMAQDSLSAALRHLGRDGLRDDNPVGRLSAECRVLAELAGGANELRAETLARLATQYTTAAQEGATVTMASGFAATTSASKTVDDPGSEYGKSTGDNVNHREPVVAAAADHRPPSRSPAVPPMPPSDNRLGDDKLVIATESNESNGDRRSTPPMPPPGMKRAGS